MKKGIIGLLLLLIVIPFTPEYCGASNTNLERDIQTSLEESSAAVKKAKEKQKKGISNQEEIKHLKSNSGQIKAVHAQLKDKFRQRGEELKSISQLASERHRAMEEGYDKAMEEYVSLIGSLPPENGNRPDISGDQTIDELEAFLDKSLHKTKTSILGTLPYRELNYSHIEPCRAPAIIPAYRGGNKVVGTDDTKSTEEAPISEEIALLAQSLNWSPVSIYEYVKNSIETEWYRGCMKGAEETLSQKSGNDCDQAALLVALLRASGFPSRYVRGTIQFFAGGKDIVIDKVKNLTGIDDPLKISEFFQKAGIPFSVVISGGVISNFEIEHIWVESQIPYSNYRGNVMDEQGKRWLGLDTSIKVKGYTYNNPADIFQNPAIGNQLSVIRDEYLGLQANPALPTPVDYLEEKIAALGDPAEHYKLKRSIIPEVLNILPNSMQFIAVGITDEYTEIPDELKHKIRFIATDSNNTELFNFEQRTLALSNQKISISYDPETVEDQQIIDSYGGLDNTPAYLVKLRPVLVINEERRAVASNGLNMGADYNLTIELLSPGELVERITNTMIAGNVASIGIVAQKATGDQLPTVGQEADAANIYFMEANSYINRWNKAEEELASLFHLTMIRPVPTITTMGGVINVTYLLDLPHGFEWKGVYVHANLRAIGTVGAHGDAPAQSQRQKIFMQLSALEGSVLEHRIFEDDFQVESISTAKLFQIVGAYGNTPSIVTIDKSNIETVLPTLAVDEGIKEDIQNSVNQNLIVRFPSADGLPLTAHSYLDWTGIGYIKENPNTGEAGYMLTGMIAGGMTAVSTNNWLSNSLENALNNPYSSNFVLQPAMVFIIFPYDGANLSVSTIDVEGIVTDPIAQVTVNGVKAIVAKDGRFIAQGVTLSEGLNQLIATASLPFTRPVSQSINVTYKPAEVTALTISITYPESNATINGPFTIVRGTITTDAKEISIKINGVAAEVSGNEFVLNNLPLINGKNRIVVNAVDSNGAVGRAEITVEADTTKRYIRLYANITSGIPPLTSYFQVSTEIPNQVVSYQMDFEGKGEIGYAGETFEDITYSYTSEGIYNPRITVTDDQGNTYSDSTTVVVLNKEKIDALLKGKWEEMKRALLEGNIEQAVTYFTLRSKEKYLKILSALKDHWPSILGTFIEFNIKNVYERIAPYEIVANENGVLYSYPGTFFKNIDGIWQFVDF